MGMDSSAVPNGSRQVVLLLLSHFRGGRCDPSLRCVGAGAQPAKKTPTGIVRTNRLGEEYKSGFLVLFGFRR